MASVYRKVAITTDHIGQMRMFFDKDGNDHYGVCYLDNGSLLWQCVDGNGYETTVTHTIEEIQLPTEEEIKKQMSQFDTASSHVSGMYRTGVRDGAKLFLNHIEKGGEW